MIGIEAARINRTQFSCARSHRDKSPRTGDPRGDVHKFGRPVGLTWPGLADEFFDGRSCGESLE